MPKIDIFSKSREEKKPFVPFSKSETPFSDIMEMNFPMLKVINNPTEEI